MDVISTFNLMLYQTERESTTIWKTEALTWGREGLGCLGPTRKILPVDIQEVQLGFGEGDIGWKGKTQTLICTYCVLGTVLEILYLISTTSPSNGIPHLYR